MSYSSISCPNSLDVWKPGYPGPSDYNSPTPHNQSDLISNLISPWTLTHCYSRGNFQATSEVSQPFQPRENPGLNRPSKTIHNLISQFRVLGVPNRPAPFRSATRTRTRTRSRYSKSVCRYIQRRSVWSIPRHCHPRPANTYDRCLFLLTAPGPQIPNFPQSPILNFQTRENADDGCSIPHPFLSRSNGLVEQFGTIKDPIQYRLCRRTEITMLLHVIFVPHRIPPQPLSSQILSTADPSHSIKKILACACSCAVLTVLTFASNHGFENFPLLSSPEAILRTFRGSTILLNELLSQTRKKT
ncbi:uncharacterized protein BDR25DRAFT_355821 [Lindgomyces ingoldianus]|uniref:Uncharacterized protein n=1 Tax=Lindgomyces ingoldianus TaxID=673940 RepID=A0ACB6QT93_9PLEO|nr:uncharacterized protein BDR25DRAFT_355821 [Lindgomyces ingoldianus]KAF2470111.1 hypothetical protein BDR25DRAFT_355821 [Lindgomyces ingoldianus]